MCRYYWINNVDFILLTEVLSLKNSPEKVEQRAARRVEKERAAMEEARRIQERRAVRVENIKSGAAVSWFFFSTMGIGAAIVIVSIIVIWLAMSMEYRCTGSTNNQKCWIQFR